ncbi:adenine phosphoribosyltransferase [Gordonia jinghuaiqii]|uniref:Adenine phosphoribosyltransferase n=1 Tax=Gordonia jinghuaiqii TaxID=2758710 RepID=A0A7D7QG77_9ACTN|nr:phosphoribosyltransferase family protein [Gordonia jinghuaiqii]MCR5976683.1 adenine phosphoribosyltransferase [Gordonia jinghuaiqii]QMS99863.1 adenine phosphoribosyltransferase [Gordonia jinghuaiqii]
MSAGVYTATIGSQTVELPLIEVAEDLTIALLMTIDHGVAFNQIAGGELAEQIRDADVELVVSAATLGIPVAIEVTRALGLDDYLILQKSNKVHLREALSEPLKSITSDGRQRLLLDPARLGQLDGARVAFVDDVISSGASVNAAITLLERAGAEVVAIGALLTEGDQWREVLGSRSSMVRALGTIPTFPGHQTAE